MISQFFVVSMRGDTIIHKDCKHFIISLTLYIVRHDINIGKYNTTLEVFLSTVGVSNTYSEDNMNLIEPFFVCFFSEDEIVNRSEVECSSHT